MPPSCSMILTTSRGSHDLQPESYSRMKLSDLGRLDDGEPSEESSLDEKGPIARESNV